MYYLVMAWLPALIGASPLFVKRRVIPGVCVFFIAGILLQALAWMAQPTTAYPLFGFAGLMTVIVLTASALVDFIVSDRLTWAALAPLTGFLLFILSFVPGWSIFNANYYSHMIGQMETHEWTQDVQPKDPHHMMMVTLENAIYLAKKAMGQDGAIGSQFNLDSDTVTLQRYHNELVYVFPLEFAGFSVWTSSDGIPAYIVVYAEDPSRTPAFVKLPKGQELNYSPGAYFSHYLTRHLREQGYLYVLLNDPRFLLDDNGQPWWVTTTTRPTVAWSGEKITGILTTNPISGETVAYTVENAPAWIERIIPYRLARDYISWWGDLSGGWWNSFWSSKNLTRPEKTMLVYSSNNRLVYVTDVTSSNGKDDSLVGLVYTDTRTGAATFYSVGGGGTAKAILAAVNHNQDVQYKHLHGDNAQIYNIDGTIGVVVPLLNANDGYQGVAIVELQNPQEVAVGATQFEALHNYQKILARHGQQIAVENAAVAKTLRGTITRIHMDVPSSGGSIYYFTLDGFPHILTASSQDYPKLPLAEKGDTVEVGYISSTESVLPVMKFDDLSIVLEGSNQTALSAK
jgi:hypothetical protein